ncbi:MAG: hypothetical protein M1281_14620 [Chloroflexi bacterium]|nr:hypothetical protein [Chloroflexota bacterium]
MDERDYADELNRLFDPTRQSPAAPRNSALPEDAEKTLELARTLTGFKFTPRGEHQNSLRLRMAALAQAKRPAPQERPAVFTRLRPALQAGGLVILIVAAIWGLSWIFKGLRPVPAAVPPLPGTTMPAPPATPAATITPGPTFTDRPAMTTGATQAPAETAVPLPTPELYREYSTLLEAGQVALFNILTPGFVPDGLPFAKASVSDYPGGLQEVRQWYLQPAGQPDANQKMLFVELSNSPEAVTPDTLNRQLKTTALDVRETMVGGAAGYLWWQQSGSGGNSAWLAWRDGELNVYLSLSGDWPQPDAANPHGLDTALLNIAASMDAPSYVPTPTALPADWQEVTSPTWPVTLSLPAGWKAVSTDAYQGPVGSARLEAFSGPGSNSGQACEWEANFHPELYGPSPAIAVLPTSASSADPSGSPCWIAGVNGGPSALIFPNPTPSDGIRFLILRLEGTQAEAIARSLSYTPYIPAQPTLTGSSFNTDPGSIQPPETITPDVTRSNGLTVEAYPIVSAGVDSPGWFEFNRRIPASILEGRQAYRQSTPGNPLAPVTVGGKQVTVEETSLNSSQYGNTQALVKVDGQVVFQYTLTPFGASSHIYRLGSYDGHWILEVDGMLVQDGRILNQDLGYTEIFNWSLLDGKPFYFFVKDGQVSISYAGQALPVAYQQVVHRLCCEPAAFNVGSSDQMVWFYALKDEVWNYVEVGMFQ